MEQNIEEIYKAHSKTVYKYLFCLSQNESLSEELTQETFYWATRSIKKFRNECKIEVWLCKIAKNLWYKELKRSKKLVLLSMETEVGEIKSEINIEEEIIESEEKAEVYKSIEKLEGETKELIYLKLTSELTFKDIAQILGKTETWARVTYYRWKKEIRKKEEMEDK